MKDDVFVCFVLVVLTWMPLVYLAPAINSNYKKDKNIKHQEDRDFRSKKNVNNHVVLRNKDESDLENIKILHKYRKEESEQTNRENINSNEADVQEPKKGDSGEEPLEGNDDETVEDDLDEKPQESNKPDEQDEENVENSNRDKQSIDDEGNIQRPLQSGDYFTPRELVPVAEKLLEKVENPGEGKGIISMERSADELAAKLFNLFFLTERRIVTLKEPDISGLDAMQALALSGQEVDPVVPLSITESPENFKEKVYEPSSVKVSKYMLLSKQKPQKGYRKRNKKRFYRVSVKKDLSQSGKCVTKGVCTSMHDERIASPKPSAAVLYPGTKCQFRYVCSVPGDLDTCNLQTHCQNVAIMRKLMEMDTDRYKREKAILRFRKMLGISYVDEEVEKILESRYMVIGTRHDFREFANMADYIHRLMMKQYYQKTTPMVPDEDESKQKNYSDVADDEVTRNKSDFGEVIESDHEDPIESARRKFLELKLKKRNLAIPKQQSTAVTHMHNKIKK